MPAKINSIKQRHLEFSLGSHLGRILELKASQSWFLGVLRTGPSFVRFLAALSKFFVAIGHLEVPLLALIGQAVLRLALLLVDDSLGRGYGVRNVLGDDLLDSRMLD